MTWALPDGWRWKPVGESLTPIREQARPDDIGDDCIYVGLEHVRSGTGEYLGVPAGVAGIKSSKFRFEAGDLLYGKLRPNLRKSVVAVSAGVCSTDLVPLRPINPRAVHMLAMQLRSEPFTADVMRMIGGANLPRVNIKDLLAIRLPQPPEIDEDRLYDMASSVSSLRRTQRELEASIAMVDLAATAAVLGLARTERTSLKAVAATSP